MSDDRMADAKAQFTRAAQAVIDGDADAVELCAEALTAIEAARTAQAERQVRSTGGPQQ